MITYVNIIVKKTNKNVSVIPLYSPPLEGGGLRWGCVYSHANGNLNII